MSLNSFQNLNYESIVFVFFYFFEKKSHLQLSSRRDDDLCPGTGRLKSQTSRSFR